jgi:hypothetical protein
MTAYHFYGEPTLRGLSELQGKDFLTGQPLIGKGRG